MRIPRVYSTQPLDTSRQVVLDASAARHLLHSLRLKNGDPIIVFDGSGRDFDAALYVRDKRTCLADVGEVRDEEHPPALKIRLAIGISRGERMDFALQKAVELGVWDIAPLFTERTVVQLKGDRLASRHSHWLGVIRHACEQSGRSLLPGLATARSLGEWLAGFQGEGLLLDHRARTDLRDIARPKHEVSLLVGPEGGLSAEERTAAMDSGLQSIRLGPRILRTETAPLAAISALQTLWGDFNGVA